MTTPGQGAAELDPAEGEAPQAGAKLIGRQRRSELLGEASFAMKQGGADGGEVSTSNAPQPRLLGRA